MTPEAASAAARGPFCANLGVSCFAPESGARVPTRREPGRLGSSGEIDANPVETGPAPAGGGTSKIFGASDERRSHRKPPRELADVRTWAEVESEVTSVKQPRLFLSRRVLFSVHSSFKSTFH